ncbi:MAG TPA: DEAD/DEAH box helicase, partial [Clostridiales bacterium]|nr:DEAD/DEAH box helicase [Clostridiales bacterium]
MNRFGVESIHTALRNRLIEYIRAQYLGENDLLLKACEQLLTEEGNLFRTPYIEANPAYITEENGIEKSDIPQHIKEFLIDMAANNLGVYRNPYKHQIEALEHFYKGKNLFVTTGTGSGKTECFMWPMISSLFEESLMHPESWKMRGVRALLLYPMNALVSDQIGRLRKIMGYQEGKFREIFRKNSKNNASRIPQFGMYTGRTPYPGQKDINKKQDRSLANTLEKAIANRESEEIDKLKKIGRYPAKAKLSSYIESLKTGNHITDENDAELLTRFEMQETCPDILITNYSMLEYMLLRPIEQGIWKSTRDWLDSNVTNKLLIIIDEAHMYKGASGGEVALLLRRLMYHLGIGIERIRFILTSASIPHNTEKDENNIYKFVCDFTAQNSPKGNFKIISGYTENIKKDCLRNIPLEKLMTLDADAFLSDDETKIRAICNFADKVCGEIVVLKSLSEAEEWLYNNLTKYTQFISMINLCRDKPVELQEIAAECFPDAPMEKAIEAAQIMLAIAPLARNKEGRVLFPARLHMFFRGLTGLYACSNPLCKYKISGDGITLGKIYCNDMIKECECGGQIYELVNDRRCGALFFKVFMKADGNCKKYAWNNPGNVYKEELKEVHLYIVPKDQHIRASKNIKIGWLDSQTGFVYYDNDIYAGKEGFIKVAHSFKHMESKPNQQTFIECPKCERGLRYYSLSDFRTKGNEPFYNIVKEQLIVQPELIHDPKKLKQFPNGGKKVLLFSDSRQRAAVLAKDMSRAADDDASRQIVTLAVIKLQEWSKLDGKTLSIHPYLYPAFLHVAYENNIQCFYGNDKNRFKEHIAKISEKIEKYRS